MTESYSHKTVQLLGELFEKYKDRLMEGLGGMKRLMWLAVRPEIRGMLRDLDNHPELLAEARPVVAQVLDALEQDTGNADETHND